MANLLGWLSSTGTRAPRGAPKLAKVVFLEGKE